MNNDFFTLDCIEWNNASPKNLAIFVYDQNNNTYKFDIPRVMTRADESRHNSKTFMRDLCTIADVTTTTTNYVSFKSADIKICPFIVARKDMKLVPNVHKSLIKHRITLDNDGMLFLPESKEYYIGIKGLLEKSPETVKYFQVNATPEFDKVYISGNATFTEVFARYIYVHNSGLQLRVRKPRRGIPRDFMLLALQKTQFMQALNKKRADKKVATTQKATSDVTVESRKVNVVAVIDECCADLPNYAEIRKRVLAHTVAEADYKAAARMIAKNAIPTIFAEQRRAGKFIGVETVHEQLTMFLKDVTVVNDANISETLSRTQVKALQEVCPHATDTESKASDSAVFLAMSGGKKYAKCRCGMYVTISKFRTDAIAELRSANIDPDKMLSPDSAHRAHIIPRAASGHDCYVYFADKVLLQNWQYRCRDCNVDDKTSPLIVTEAVADGLLACKKTFELLAEMMFENFKYNSMQTSRERLFEMYSQVVALQGTYTQAERIFAAIVDVFVKKRAVADIAWRTDFGGASSSSKK
jgi:hypothetical protein